MFAKFKGAIKYIIFILVVIFLICLLIFTIGFLKKIYVFNNIYKECENNVLKENYDLKINYQIDEGDIVTSEAYYRNGIGKLISSDSSIYTWAKDDEGYVINAEKKVAIQLDTDENDTVYTLVNSRYFANITGGYYYSTIARIMACIDTNISVKSAKYNDIDCYYIVEKDKTNKVTKEYYVSKDKKYPVHTEIINEDGSNAKYDYSLSFYNLKYTDVESVDFTSEGYTVVNISNVLDVFQVLSGNISDATVVTSDDTTYDNSNLNLVLNTAE